MNCCGKEVKTPFCPMCGKPTERTPLMTLLWHIQRHIELNKRALSKPEQYEGNHKSCKKALEKWSAWAEELKRVMQTDQALKGKPSRKGE